MARREKAGRQACPSLGQLYAIAPLHTKLTHDEKLVLMNERYAVAELGVMIAKNDGWDWCGYLTVDGRHGRWCGFRCHSRAALSVLR